MPALQATERWMDRRMTFNIQANQWTATMGWDVVGFDGDEQVAIAATGMSVGQVHPRNSSLTCQTIGLQGDQFSLGRVVAQFAVQTITGGTNPLTQPPVITWRPGQVSGAVDTDIYGNPIVNAAGTPFTPGNRPFNVKFLTITRYEIFWQQSVSDTYSDSTNSDSVSFQGITYPPGQMKCHTICPDQPYSATGAPYVHIAYNFEIRTPNPNYATVNQARYPFQRRILNQGRLGWYEQSSVYYQGPILDAQFKRVTHDVLLDANGQPLDTNSYPFIEGINNGSPNLPVDTPTQFALNPNVVTDRITNGGSTACFYLIYKEFPELPFNDIGLS
jgi:hypothetical protein